MRIYIGVIAASLAIPSMAAAAGPNQSDYLIKISKKDRDDCLNGNKSDRLCDLVREQAAHAKVKAHSPITASAKPITVTPVPQTPTIPPLITMPISPWCISNSKGVFLRADPLDNFHYLVDPTTPSTTSSSSSTAGSSKGASISYTDDRATRSQTATINGRLSYLIFGDQCDAPNTREPFIAGVALAPFVSSNGTWNQPFKTTSNSALKMGADFQVASSTANFSPLLDYSYFYISPYYQTDFRGLANIDSLVLAWEPVSYNLFMDSGPINPYFSFFWQLRLEAELVNVNTPGLTKFAKGDYAWLGETVRANLGLFPENPQISWPDYLRGRLSLIGTAQNFYDTNSVPKVSRTANYYSLEVQYKLGACRQPAVTGQNASSACATEGSSSISFEYDWGTNVDTLVFANQYLLKFNYAY